MTELAVRQCEEDDLTYFGRFGAEKHVEFCRESFRRMQQDEAVVILVAVDPDGAPVGKVHVDFASRADAPLLVAAAVAPERRNRGIGTTLITAGEDLARVRGFSVVDVGVEDSNPRARRLYERLGYAVIGESEFPYEGAPVPNPGVMMRKKVRVGVTW